MKINNVVAYLDDRFHPEYQENYDNAGFLLGDSSAEYNGALVALDLTAAVIEEARTLGLNLIVTHHPFIFSGLKRLTDRSEAGRMAIDMIRSGISTYAAHTNLDNLPDGVNGILAERLGLHNCCILRPCGELSPSYSPLNGQSIGHSVAIGAGMIGNLDTALDSDIFLARVKQQLGLPVVRHNGVHRSVQRIAICGGSGAEFIGDALQSGADAFLTADLKYHDFQRPEGRMLLADIGHFESEQFACEIISRVISEKFCNFACRISQCQKSIVSYI